LRKQYSIAEARDRLPRLVRDAEQSGPIELTRRGKRVAVIISQDEFDRLTTSRSTVWDVIQELRSRPDFDELALSPEDFQGLRDRSPGREIDF
jgi:antitoxin Phd